MEIEDEQKKEYKKVNINIKKMAVKTTTTTTTTTMMMMMMMMMMMKRCKVDEMVVMEEP
jgi:hypothetical protein